MGKNLKTLQKYSKAGDNILNQDEQLYVLPHFESLQYI